MQKYFLPVFFGLFCGFAFGQPYVFNSYTVGDGLPQSQVYALLTDSKGYLWLGTQGGGLAKYDGRRFQNFTVKQGLPDNNVNAILEDGDGNIWLGTNTGLCRFNGKKFDHIELEKGQKIIVNALAILNDKDGASLFAMSNNGLYSLLLLAQGVSSASAHLPIANKKTELPFGRLTAGFIDRKNKLWVGGDDGLFIYENGQWRTIQRRKAEVLAIQEMKDGRTLAGIFNSGVLILDGKKRSYLNTQNGLPSNKVQCLWENPVDRKIWIGLQDAGLCIWSPGTGAVERITVEQGLCHRNIRSIEGDPSGKVVWLGTSGGGVCKYAIRSFEHFDMGDGLRSNFVYDVCKDPFRLGHWFAAGDLGFSYMGPASDSLNAPTVLRHYDASNGFYNIKCRTLYHDLRSHQLWIGTEGLGLAIFDERDSTAFHFFSKKNGLAGNWIRDIVRAPSGEIWVATTDGGISRVTFPTTDPYDLRFRNFGQKDGLTDLTVYALHIDKKGRVWFGAENGDVGFIEGEKVRVFGRENGLPGTMVRSLSEDGNDQLWVGTAGNGVGFANIYSSGTVRFKGFDQMDSLASANVYLLVNDRDGNLWVGTEKGVDRIKLDTAGHFDEVKHFSKSEGFVGMETCQNAATNDDLWFGTMNGLMHYLPSNIAYLGVAPKPVLTGVKLFYEPLENSKMSRWAENWGGLVNGAVFPYNQNHLGFEFFATDFSNQERVMYSWRLASQETDWSPFSNRTEVSYANLPPGDYRFLLRARNEDGVTSEPIEVAFVIAPPFWQTWWFRISAVAAIGLILWMWFRWRIRQVKLKAAQEREQLELQNRLLTLEQKSRQLQMNPHFIFNALNSIQSLVSAGNMDAARQYILKFGRLMRAILDNSRQAMIPLDKEVETLRQYLEMEQFCRDGKFDYDLDTTGIETPDLQVPPMLLQPFVENSILHGIGPLSNKKGLIQINFKEQEDHLEVTIHDNGIGIEQSQARKAGQEPDRQSVGIAVTQERLELLKTEAGFASPAVEMHQVVGQDGEVEGTEVVVRMGC